MRNLYSTCYNKNTNRYITSGELDKEMQGKSLPVVEGTFNLKNYEETYQTFSWSDVERDFSWYETGKVNMAFEAIDRHCETERKDKVALYYSDANRDEKYTFLDLKKLSNKFANVLRGLGITKGDRVFVFMPRSPELYVAALGDNQSRGYSWTLHLKPLCKEL